MAEWGEHTPRMLNEQQVFLAEFVEDDALPDLVCVPGVHPASFFNESIASGRKPDHSTVPPDG